jgi:hypothetical protein
MSRSATSIAQGRITLDRWMDSCAGALARSSSSPLSPSRPRGRARHQRRLPIPGFPGERIDRRLLPDIEWMVRRFHVFVTDGYSLSHSHQATGEHPRGLAVDLVPGEGGSWADVHRLAEWAEPQQDQPRPPFRWVGWRGDKGHGDPGHCRPTRRHKPCFPHLHISWQHAEGPGARPAAWVMVLRFRRLG